MRLCAVATSPTPGSRLLISDASTVATRLGDQPLRQPWMRHSLVTEFTRSDTWQP
jgi:hypothetical protein